jgi:hypothetical protein
LFYSKHPKAIISVERQNQSVKLTASKAKLTMSKPAKDLRIHGVTFEDAVKRMIAAPVAPKPAKTIPKKKRQNPARN